MNAAQIRSLPVQSGLTAGLFLGCIVLAGLLVSQRWRFESWVKETYTLPKAELSASTRTVTESLLHGEAAADEWKRVPEPERRSVYLTLMQRDEFPTAKLVKDCLDTDADFFLTCSERTVVCGNREQRLRGLRFLEFSGVKRSVPVLDRLSAWAKRSRRHEVAMEIDHVRHRIESGANF